MIGNLDSLGIAEQNIAKQELVAASCILVLSTLGRIGGEVDSRAKHELAVTWLRQLESHSGYFPDALITSSVEFLIHQVPKAPVLGFLEPELQVPVLDLFNFGDSRNPPMVRQDVPHDLVRNGGVLDRGLLNLTQLKATLTEHGLELANPYFGYIGKRFFCQEVFRDQIFKVFVLKLLEVIEIHVSAIVAIVTDSAALSKEGALFGGLKKIQ